MRIDRNNVLYVAYSIFLVCAVYLFTITSLYPVTAGQSSKSQIEKQFENSMLIFPDSLVRVEKFFKNSSFSSNKGNWDSAVFDNTNLVIAQMISSNSPDYLTVNTNTSNPDIENEEFIFGDDPHDINLSNLIEISSPFNANGQNARISSGGQAPQLNNKLTIGNFNKKNNYAIGLNGIDFVTSSSLYIDKDAGAEEEGGSTANPSNYAYNYASLLNINADNNLAATESEMSINIAELEAEAEKLPTSNMLGDSTNLKEFNIAAISGTHPAENALPALPELDITGKKVFSKVYAVSKDETLFSISKKFNVQVSELMEANKLSSIEIKPGATLMVPDMPAVSSTLALNAPTVEADPKADTGKKTEIAKAKSRPELPATLTRNLLWPAASRRVTSRFGVRVHPIYHVKKFHNGLDIGASYGSKIRAAENGVVVYSGWKSYYGRLVIIKHSKDLYTLYAHCSSLIAKSGQYVKRGDPIARIGSSGLSTGPHLHFGVQKNGSFVSPMKYL